MKKIYGSKKATFTVGGIGLIPAVTLILTWLLSQAGAEPDLIDSLVTVVAWCMAFVLGGYNVGQGIADINKT